MKKKKLVAVISELEEKLLELQPPSTKIDWRRLSISLFEDAVDFFKIKNIYSIQENRKIIDKRIAETIDKYGLMKFEGNNLYHITSIYQLHRALVLIESGMVDYYHVNRSKIKYDSDAMSIRDRFIRKGEVDENYFAQKARELSATQKEYDDLLHIFISYAEEKLFYKGIEREIEHCINTYGIDKYLGTQLYEITDIKLYQEAVKAIEKMHRLKTLYGITEHNGAPIEELSNYELDGILQARPKSKQNRKKAA
ncbi:hypothetical protein [Parafilimonas terrae]|uniref:Uncharacterized protein n=1 Tax=Parafilimonas terrae TaxID=1465490 RepID=A0A1I5UBD1_9BACT|nr:hypothetical protein [Parafilimonas terrae]SFP92619.1 hypothetical protein SAMN05444277_103186 [Parafilimonas terrae]